MAKNRPVFNMISFGIYTGWDERSKTLPKLLEPTTSVPLREGIEFGFIVQVSKAKSEKLHYCIEHPGIPDENGLPQAPFEGDVVVRTNQWDFYLGDTIWLPLHDKAGHWHMSLSHSGNVVAENTFMIEEERYGERTLGEGRSFFKPKKRW